MYHKPTNAMRCMLVYPKDKIMKKKTMWLNPPHHLQRWSQTYIVGELKQPLGVRFKKHTKLDRPTGVDEHCLNTNHSISLTNTKVLERELDWQGR